ncbi:MAG: MBOAT family O-acyltransferase [Myxococcota bacterium]|nr:MBOAT family O-acyltransferase [Myxococcota bacterium]
MRFDSLVFPFFLAAVALAHAPLRTARAQNLFLLACSYIFYGWVDPLFCLLIGFSTAVDYGVTQAMAAPGANRKGLLWMSVATNLGILGVFKYLDFFVENIASAASMLGFQAHPTSLGLLLPIGVSFYTFQSLGYTIDVYQRRIKPCRDPVQFALFISFFPQLVSGPIERASQILPQLETRREWSTTNLQQALPLLLRGWTLKLVVADGLAPHVDRVFALSNPGPALLVAGTLAFSLQILADFSAYTDLARGAAKLLGINLVENFKRPYAALSPSHFWRRWHISLSHWFRDYVYIPLGGSRHSRLRLGATLMCTLGLAGVWHGAGWHFLAWGLFHGIALWVGHYLGWNASWKPRNAQQAVLGWGATMAIVGLGWAIFRAPSLSWILDAMMPHSHSPEALGSALLLLAVCATHALYWLLEYWLQRSPKPLAQGAFSAVCVIACLLLSPELRGDFLYFRF